MDSIDNFSSEIYEYEEDDEILDATKTQMVLGSLEKSLVNLIIKEIHNFDKNSGLSNKAYIAFTTTYRREPKDNIELIRKSNLSMLPGIARQILADSSLSKYLIRLEDLMNALQIYTSRSQSYAHPGNEYSPVHWARVQALALDPVMHQLGFIPVIERYYAAKKGELERIDLSDAYLNEIPNNLPNPDCEQLIGREKISKDIKKAILNPRKPSISIFGAGGTGKTALTLSVLNELKIFQETKEFDCILFASLKDEFLEAGLVRKEIIDLTINGVKSQLIEGFIEISNQFTNIEGENEFLDPDKNLNNWDEFVEAFKNYKFLIWIDNLETLKDDLYEIFSNFEADLPRDWKIIVTSRIRIRESSSIFPLGPLGNKSAASLFQKIYFDKLGKKVDFQDALSYSEKLFCNPLAIKNAIGYQKKTNLSLIESVQSSSEQIIEFSYKKLIGSINEFTKSCLEVLFVFGKSNKLDITKQIEINIDEVSEAITEIEDLGLAIRGTTKDDYIELNDNFRSYLSIYPLNEVLRSNLNIYKDERLKTDISPVEALSNEWSNQMSASYLSPNDQIDDTTKSILTDSIKNLKQIYALKSKEVVDHSTNEELLKKLRESLKQLEELIDSKNQNADIPPAAFRLIGLIYQEFGDISQMTKFLTFAAEKEDPNSLLTLFYRYNEFKDPKSTEYGFRFFDSLNIPRPDSIPYAKFITAFSNHLNNQNNFDDVMKITSDFAEKRTNLRILFMVIRAETYSRKANFLLKDMRKEMINQENADEVSKNIKLAFKAFDECNDTAYYTRKRSLGLYHLANASIGFIKKSKTPRVNLLFDKEFMNIVFSLKELYINQIYNDRYEYIKAKKDKIFQQKQMQALEAHKEFLEDTCRFNSIENFTNKNTIFLDKNRWYLTTRKKLKFKSFSKFDSKEAIFIDNENNTFFISLSKYNYISKDESKSKIPPFYRLNKDIALDCTVFKHYVNKQAHTLKRDSIITIH